MGIRDRLRKQRELERQQLETDQQTVPEAIESVISDMVEKVVLATIPEEAVVEPIVEEAVVEPCTLSAGTYRISGFYKQGLELYFDDFTLKPTPSCLLCGNSRIKGSKNPFMALLNQRYVLIVTIDPYLLSIKIGKTIINEKMRINTVLSNQDITIEKID